MLALAPDQWPAAIAAVLADHAALTVAGLLPRCALLGPNLRRLPAGKNLALTFDDGPDPEVTPVVLRVLAAAGARATFFCVGQKVERWPALAREIREHGHTIENHSHLHSNAFAFLGPAAMRREIGRAQDAIMRAVGSRPRFFRAPAGIRNPWLDPVLSSLGLRLVSWTRRGFDTVDRDASRVAARLLAGLRPGDILLLHDGSAARSLEGRPVVLDTLAGILGEASRQGLRCVSLDEALAGGSVSSPGTR